MYAEQAIHKDEPAALLQGIVAEELPWFADSRHQIAQ